MDLSRRAYLAVAGAAAALAGCTSSDSDADPTTDAPSTQTPTSTDMTDRVYIQNGDVFSGDVAGDVLGRSNISDYVEDGLGFTPDFTNTELAISAGKAFIQDADGRDATLLPDSRSGLSLTADATNDVYLTFDPTSTDAISYEINTTGSEPSDPSLRVGIVDTSAETYEETNRRPDGEFESVGAREINTERHASKFSGNTLADQIHNAINDLPTYGGTVTLPAGEFTIDKPITDQGRDNVRITGQGPATKIFLKGGVTANVFEIVNQSNWGIDNLWIDGQESLQSDGDDRFNQCGILNDTSDDCSFHHLWIRNTVYTGIRNVADGNVGDGELNNCTVAFNDIRNTRAGTTANVSDLISFTSRNSGFYEHVRILFNYGAGSGHHGIETTRSAERILVQGNEMVNNGGIAYQLHNGAQNARMTIIGNHASGGNDAHFAIAANYCQSFGNVSISSPDDAFRIGDESSVDWSRFSTHYGNVAFNPANHGASLWNATGSRLLGWTINGPGGDGIRITNDTNDNCTVTNNLIRNPTGSHINVDTNVSGTIEANNQTL